MNVNARDNWGNTPLHSALLAKHAEVAGFLLKVGAETDIKNKYGWTPARLMAEDERLQKLLPTPKKEGEE